MNDESSEQRAFCEPRIRQLQGPILVLGASGFIGASLFRTLLEFRDDVHGTTTRLPAWRLDPHAPSALPC